jgi:hypothetical protein
MLIKTPIPHFDSRFFTVNGNDYEIIATQTIGGQTIHTVKNLKTKISKDVTMSSLIKWFA